VIYKRHNSQLTLHGVDLNTINEKSTDKFFQATHTASFDITGNSAVYSMSLDQQDITSTAYNHTAGQSAVTITDTGWYELSYKVNHTYKGKGGGHTSKLKASLKVNELENKKSVTWVAKNDTNKNSTNTWTGLIYLTAADTVEVILQRFGGSRWKANTYESVISIRKL